MSSRLIIFESSRHVTVTVADLESDTHMSSRAAIGASEWVLLLFVRVVTVG